MSDIEVVLHAEAELGEGPVWHPPENCLYWVDITAGAVHRWDRATGTDTVTTLGQDVGAISIRTSGGIIAAVRDGVLGVAGDGTVQRLAFVERDVPGNRFNDGKSDAAGRFWAGTMATDESERPGSLYRLDPDGTVTTMVTELGLSNGLGWSPDGRTMYLIDTPRQAVDAFDFDVDAGTLARRRRLITVEEDAGSPDGMTVDADGFLWVALYGGGAVRRYTSDGSLDRVVELPVPQPTCPTFGGPDLDELYVTSARENLSAEQLAAAPLSGAVLRHRPGVRGLPAGLFGG